MSLEISTVRHAIVVKTLNEGTVVGHVPEALAKKLQPLIKRWELYRVTAKVIGGKRKAPEGTWVLGGGIELPCVYLLNGPKLHKRFVREALKDCSTL